MNEYADSKSRLWVDAVISADKNIILCPVLIGSIEISGVSKTSQLRLLDGAGPSTQHVKDESQLRFPCSQRAAASAAYPGLVVGATLLGSEFCSTQR